MILKPFIQLKNITLRTDAGLVFARTNWTIFRNQNWAIVGSNGSGKTLLARALKGEVPVTEGEIHYNFRVRRGTLPEERICLVSFEQQKAIAGDLPEAIRWFSLAQDSAITVNEFLSQENVEEINPFQVDARREQTPRAFEIHRASMLRLLEIRPLLDQPIPSLSNGEMRKVLLARALVRKPRLLILDDVFAGLDSLFRKHLRNILDQLIRNGTVRILMIEPRPAELPGSITHLLCVQDCRAIVHGSRRTVTRHPAFRKLVRPLPPLEGRRDSSSFKKKCLSDELVRLQNASVCYDGRDILSGIDWTVRRGESWALVGPNGSGKSTLLSLISGDNPQAYANEVYLFGRRRGSGERLSDVRKRIGCISPELHLHFPDSYTCIEAVISGFYDAAFGGRRPSSEQRAAARRILKEFGMADLADHWIGSLSAGSQRMILLARALVKCPDLLLLDEPCQGLDPAHRATFIRSIEGLLDRDAATVVYVTHLPEEIPKQIRRILKLRNGRIQSVLSR